MSKYRAYTEESREEILKALTNNSSSKQAWSFSRQKRFAPKNAACPYISYGKSDSLFSNKRTGFGSSRRKVFTEVSEGPSSWVYTPSDVVRKNANSFGPGRFVIPNLRRKWSQATTSSESLWKTQGLANMKVFPRTKKRPSIACDPKLPTTATVPIL